MQADNPAYDGRPPYENAYLGAFIFTLGVLAKKTFPDATSLEVPTLLQQTPHDRPLGDLLAEWGTRHFLLEFKRTEADVQDERRAKKNKWKRVTEWQERDDNHSTYKAYHQAHWIAWGSDEGTPPDLLFLPYRAIATGPHQPDEERMSLAAFIDDMLGTVPQVGTSWPELKVYLEWLSSATGGKRRVPEAIGAFLISITQEGQIGLVRCDHHLELTQTFAGRSRQEKQSRTSQTQPRTQRRGRTQ